MMSIEKNGLKSWEQYVMLLGICLIFGHDEIPSGESMASFLILIVIHFQRQRLHTELPAELSR
jgi:hypothetical protein